GLDWLGDRRLVIASRGEAGFRLVEIEPPATVRAMRLPCGIERLCVLAGDRFAAIGDDDILRVCELGSGAVIASVQIEKWIYALLPSRDGRRLHWAGFSAAHDRRARSWSIEAPPVLVFEGLHAFEHQACLAEGARDEIWVFLEWDVVIFDGRSG